MHVFHVSMNSIHMYNFRFWLMDCQATRESSRMAQDIYTNAIVVPYMAKFVVFARRNHPKEGQLRVFCMTDDKVYYKCNIF